MTREDIIRMGIETDLFIYNGDDTSLTVWLIPTEEKFLKFASLVAAAEREACAKVCFEMAQRHNDIRSAALEMASEYIRARGDQT
jgi:hypothetical protein